MEENNYLKLMMIQIVRDIFAISLIFLFILIVLEDLKSGLVSYYLDLRILLAVCAISGAASLFTSRFFDRFGSANVDKRIG